VESTWGHGRFPFLPLPLDHCLVSDQVKIVDRQVTRSLGSDHRGVIVDFALPLPEAKPDPPKAEPFMADREGGEGEGITDERPGSELRPVSDPQ
jgi:hypothetical protein